MVAPEPSDERAAATILEVLMGDESSPPDDLETRTITKVRATVTMRDLVDLTTFVFVLQFCAPLIELIAAMFGVETQFKDGRDRDE